MLGFKIKALYVVGLHPSTKAVTLRMKSHILISFLQCEPLLTETRDMLEEFLESQSDA